MSRILVIAIALSFCAPSRAQEANMENPLIQSKPDIQKQIEQVLETIETQASGDSDSNIAVLNEIQNLKEMTDDEVEIVKQIAVFVATPGLDERQRLMAPVILNLLQLQPKIIIQALAPHFDSDNENVRSFVRDWFQGHDSCGNGTSLLQSLNFNDYLDYVRRRLNTNQEIPTAFIEYLFERSPDRALIVFYYANPTRQAEASARLKQLQEGFEADQQKRGGPDKSVVESGLRKEILLAEHTVSNAIWLKEHDFGEQFQEALPMAKQHLFTLAEKGQWWARLYAAEILRQHLEFRQADILEKLRFDNNELVSKTAKSTIK